MGKFATLTI